MRAQQLLTPKPVEEKPLLFATLPLPMPGAGQVRLKVHVCGVCHTDLHTVEGDIHPPSLPVTPGHQVVGIVDALGEGVTEVKIGERLGIPWLHAICGVCDFCRRGEENLCPNARFTGFDVDGGFAEYMLAEARFALPIPPTISDEQAAPLLCAGIIGYRSLRKADVQPGERLGLVGFGASAHLAIQVARHWGCEVCVFTRSQGHRLHARDLGAAWAGGIEDTPGKPLDRAVIFAPVGDLIPQTLAKIRPGGTLAINAIHMSNIPEMPYHLVYGERTLRSVANATYCDGVEFLELAAQIPIQSTVSVYPFAEANRALLDLKRSQINGEAVLCMV
jgi:propanol-preferring alcohol dehydrogenase